MYNKQSTTEHNTICVYNLLTEINTNVSFKMCSI